MTNDVLCAFGLKPEGGDFKSIDGQAADIFFPLLSPQDDAVGHLEFLSAISGILQSETNRTRIREFSSPQDAMAFLAMVDRQKESGLS